MHELSIAQSIIEIATEEASRRSSRVSAVHLKLGALSGVVTEALLFAYDLACEQTPLAGSRLVIEELPTVVYCPRCRKDQTLSSTQWFCCPVCDTPTSDVTQGRELEVSALELED